MEIWKDIKGYENLYQVSTYGRVKSLGNGNKCNGKGIETILKLRHTHKGYLQVMLCKNSIKQCKQVHRLVAIAFIKNPLNKKEVNHINGVKDVNNINNLEWVTCSENHKHAYKNGLMNSRKGELHSSHKLSDIQISEIRIKFIPYKYSTRRLAKEYKVSQGHISCIVLNKRRK